MTWSIGSCPTSPAKYRRCEGRHIFHAAGENIDHALPYTDIFEVASGKAGM